MSKKQDFIIKHIGWIFILGFMVFGVFVVQIQIYFDSKEKQHLNKIFSSREDNATRQRNGRTQEEINNCYKKIKYGPDSRIWICYTSEGVGDFYKLINISGSLVYDAWWSYDLKYMIINLNGINYQYCGFSRDNWVEFSKSNDKDKFYIDKIKSNFDCRDGGLPIFCDTELCIDRNSKSIRTENTFSSESHRIIF